jgi:hypothetical protein
LQINSFLAYLCNYSRSTTKNRPKKHDFSPHPALQCNGTDFAVQNPRIDNIEKQVEQEVQLVSRLSLTYEKATPKILPLCYVFIKSARKTRGITRAYSHIISVQNIPQNK